MKKSLSLFLAFVLVFSALLPVHAENPSTEQYNEAGSILEDLGLLRGDGNGNLGLEQNLKKQHMVVMISRLYGEEEKASKFTGPNKFKDLKPKHRQDIPYITWAANQGLISGKPDGTFGIDGYVTIQEYQAVLLRALGYEKDAKDWDMVPKMSSAYGLMDGLSVNPSSKMNRGQMAVMTVNALRQEKNGQDITLAQALNVTIPDAFNVDATVKTDNNTLIFEGQVTGSDNLWVYLKPISSNIEMENKLMPIPIEGNGNFSYKIENLEVGDYHYRFQSGAKNTSYEAVTIDVLPFALSDVSADNLKEIHLTFTQPVNRTIASLPSNYNTTAGSIKDIRFEDNDTKIILTLTGTMTQQKKYKLSAMKIKSASGEEETLKDYEFEAWDNTFPEVLSIKQLGDKGIRIYFSEPIKSAKSSNFKLNNKNFPGNIKLEDNMVTLSYFSSVYALSEGSHSLVVSGVKDYAGYEPMDKEHEITISKDTTAPKIVDATATLEEVIIEFDEDIDPTSANNRNFYWKSGSIKRHASKVTIKGNKAIVEFSRNTLSTNETTIYVENVVDYSSNKTNDNISVTPVIDTTSPEVLNYSVSNDGRTITVYYSKNVVGNNRKDYTILDENNKSINIRDIQGSGAEYNINLYTPLPAGLNTLTIDGVRDTTTLKNQLVTFNTTIEMKDIEKPRILNYTGYANHILIHFSKIMDMSTVTNPSNYIMNFKGRESKLPDNTLFTPSDDGKSVTILLPEYYEGDKVSIGSLNNLTEMDVIGLKDIVGNDTNPFIVNMKFNSSSTGKAKAVDYYSERPGRQGVLFESNLIKVRFNIPIVQASEDDFAIDGRRISSVIADGTDEVTIYLDDNDDTSLPTGSLRILSNNSMETYIETGVESSVITVLDEIPPRIKSDTGYLTVYGNQIELPFTERLEDEGASLYKRDLEVVRLSDNKLLSEDNYTTTLKSSDKSILVVTINNRQITSGYSIRLSGEYNLETLSYIRDRDGNLAIPSDAYLTSKDIYKQ